MSSKWKPWDFIRNAPQVVHPGRPGFWAIQVFDPFMERLLTKKIPKGELPGSLSFFLGEELRENIIETRLQTRDLFNGDESFLIIQCEGLSKSVENKLLDSIEDVVDRFVILFFTRETPFYKKLVKNDRVQSLKMEAPLSWDSMRYLNFLADEMRIKLSSEIMEYLNDSLPMTSADYVGALNLIKLHLLANNKRASIEDVRQLVGARRVDQFKLIREYTQKNFRSFYYQLIELDTDYDQLRSVFAFLESHLIKVMDTSYIQKKNRATRWDQGIEVDAKLWEPEQLHQAIRQVSELQLMAKSKSRWLRPTLQNFYYQSLEG